MPDIARLFQTRVYPIYTSHKPNNRTQDKLSLGIKIAPGRKKSRADPKESEPISK